MTTPPSKAAGCVAVAVIVLVDLALLALFVWGFVEVISWLVTK